MCVVKLFSKSCRPGLRELFPLNGHCLLTVKHFEVNWLNRPGIREFGKHIYSSLNTAFCLLGIFKAVNSVVSLDFDGYLYVSNSLCDLEDSGALAELSLRDEPCLEQTTVVH